jgi:hypothetical protein
MPDQKVHVSDKDHVISDLHHTSAERRGSGCCRSSRGGGSTGRGTPSLLTGQFAAEAGNVGEGEGAVVAGDQSFAA